MTFRPDALAGRVALVTGGARGIGLAVTRALLAAGAEVWVNARQEGAIDALCADLSPVARPLYFDVADPAAVRKAFGHLQKTSKKLDILVNNAGIMRDALIDMTSADLVDETLGTNLRGPILCSQYASRLMARRRTGTIVNVSSIMGRRGNVGQSVYAASKAGLIGLTMSLAKELASRNVRVNAVAPGAIETDLIAGLTEAKRAETLARIPLGRFGNAEEVADVCLFLASDAARYVTGQVIGIDGGMVI